MTDQVLASDAKEPPASEAPPIRRRPCLELRLGQPPLWADVLAAGLVLAPGMTIVYRLTAALDAGTAVPQWLDTPFDQQLPIVPAAVWVYLSWYPAMIILPALGGRTSVRQGAIAVVIAFMLCSVGHLLLPVSIRRPFIDPSAGMSAQMLASFYAFDPPRNLLPSFHAAGAVLLAPLQRLWSAKAAVSAWAFTLCVSCVLIKQHFIIDVLAGAGVGLMAAAVAKRMISEPIGTR